VAIIRVHPLYDGEVVKIDLPTYEIISDSWRPSIPNISGPSGILGGVAADNPRLAEITCEIIIPDEYLERGSLSENNLRSKYRGNPNWDTGGLRGRLQLVEE